MCVLKRTYVIFVRGVDGLSVGVAGIKEPKHNRRGKPCSLVAIQTLAQLFSLHCDLQPGQKVLWRRKMNPVAVLDNVPVLPADSLRQCVHVKKHKIKSNFFFFPFPAAGDSHMSATTPSPGNSWLTGIYRCEMLRKSIFFFIHISLVDERKAQTRKVSPDPCELALISKN